MKELNKNLEKMDFDQLQKHYSKYFKIMLNEHNFKNIKQKILNSNNKVYIYLV